MMIEKKLCEKLQITDYTVLGRFCSRRNAVYHINAHREDGQTFDFVYKAYLYGDMQNEAESLRRMQGQNVPAVIAQGDQALCLEYIKGPLLLECLEQSEAQGQPFDKYVDCLLSFLQRFYVIMPGIAYGDTNLRNFICAAHGLCGIDMEEVRHGDKAADIGKAAAYILTYDPTHTSCKQQAAHYLIQNGAARFGISAKHIEEQMHRELEAMHVRRALKNARHMHDGIGKKA